ncbi:MAG: hypothetical protein QME90_04320 [Thermodesulfobacteriota bacterium]|nr:hypothetical protein [Thermodesulfobacteriota bacterium]
MEKRIGFSTYFTLLIAVVMLIAAIDATQMPFMAAVYPGSVAAVMFVVAVAQLIQDFRKGQTTVGAIDIEKAAVPDEVRYRKGLRAYIWLMGLYLAIILFGFKLGTIAFLIGYLKSEDKSRWLKIVLICAGTFVVLDSFNRFFEVWWPSGLLGDLLEESVPWLF